MPLCPTTTLKRRTIIEHVNYLTIIINVVAIVNTPKGIGLPWSGVPFLPTFEGARGIAPPMFPPL